MYTNTLPNQRDKILAAIHITQADGPPAIGRLTVLCCHLARQADDPRLSHEGPSGLKPIEYLQDVMRSMLKPKERPDRDLVYFGLTQNYPRPKSLQSKTKVVKSVIAKQWVQDALLKAKREGHLGRQHHIYCEALTKLWQRGVANSDLQPLVDAATDEKYFMNDPYGFDVGSAIETMIGINEWEQAIKLLEPIPIAEKVGYEHRVTGVELRVKAAKSLVQIGRPDIARVVLDRIEEHRDQLPNKPIGHIDIRCEIANAWAYLGEVAIARKLSPNEYLINVVDLECIIALVGYYTNGTADPTILLDLLDRTVSLKPPKSRASTQLDILDTLLAVSAYDAAWRVLDYIRQTLLETPLWGKREHRTDDAVQLISPYIDEHTAPTFRFASGLLIDTATSVGPGDFWNIVFVVSGLRWLIHHWAGVEGIRQIVSYLHF